MLITPPGSRNGQSKQLCCSRTRTHAELARSTMATAATPHLKELTRLMRELESAPPGSRVAASQEMAAWLRRNAPNELSAQGSSRSCKHFALAFLVVALPLVLIMHPTATVRSNAQLVRREAAGLVAPVSVTRPQSCDCKEEKRQRSAPAPVPASGRVGGTSDQLGSVTPTSLPPQGYPSHEAFMHPHEGLRKLRPNRTTSDFPLIVCIGQGKTATKSLNKAFFMLGMRTAHFYGAGLYGLLYDNVAEKVDHDFLFSREIVNGVLEKHVDAVLDTPVVDFYNEILLTYPNAKFILTVRGVKSWMGSQHKFYSYYARGCANWLAPWRRGSNLVYGTECPSPEQALKRYLQHNRNVIDAIPREKLLVMDIPGGDGWAKLCPFIGKPLPPSNWTFPSRH